MAFRLTVPSVVPFCSKQCAMKRLQLSPEALRRADRGADNVRMVRGGIEMVRTVRPNLVFLDLHLADLTGEEVLRQIWVDPATRHIPVAVLSADATSHSQRRLLTSDATAYLTRPFDIVDVFHLLDKVLGRSA